MKGKRRYITNRDKGEARRRAITSSQVTLRKAPTLGEHLGVVVVGLTLACVSIGAVAICVEWCYSEYQFALDKVEGNGRVINRESHKVQTSLRYRTRITWNTLIVDSEHGELKIESKEPLPLGSTVHYDYSPSRQEARLHGQSLFWWMCLFIFLTIGIGILLQVPLLPAYRQLYGQIRRWTSSAESNAPDRASTGSE